MDNIDNIEINLDAIEAGHQKLLQLYKNSEVPKEETIPMTLDSILDADDVAPQLIDSSLWKRTDPLESISCTGTGYFGVDISDKSMISLNGAYANSPKVQHTASYRGTEGDYSEQMKMFDNDETDPRGQVSYRGYRTPHDIYNEQVKLYKSQKNKGDKWEVHAWEDDSEEDMNVIFDRINGVEGNISDHEFADFGNDANPWNTLETTSKSQSKPDMNREMIVQIQEKMEEIAVTVDKTATDVSELSRDMGEMLPLVSDTNEDVRSLNTEVSKLTKRVTTVEQSLKKLEIGIDSLNILMQIIVDHIQQKEL